MLKLKKRYFLIIAIVIGSAFTFSDNLFEISKNLEIFADVYKTTNQYYVDEPKSGELMKVGIRSMLKTLDPYTYYFSEAEAEDAMVKFTGEYGGIGFGLAEIGEYITVTDVFDNSPAQKNDIRIGDQIDKINGKDFKGKKMNEIGTTFKGTAKTEITISIKRPGVGNIEKTMNMAEIRRKNVPYFGKLNDNTGYVILTSFKENCANEIKDAIKELKKDGAYRLVLDLRNNPGGLLHEAVNIVNIFTPKGTVAVETKGRHSSSNVTYKTRFNSTDEGIPIIVLVNGRSASASEIVSGCLQDLDRGVIMGETTFGKGLVQSIKNLKYRTQMRVTTAKYYTTSGRCIQRIDYSTKDKNGKAVEYSDENRKVFYTKNKRKVLDGKGVEPDVVIKKEKDSDFITQLKKSGVIFQFAAEYRNKNEKKSITKFKDIDDKLFKGFVRYCLLDKSHYKTKAENLVDSLSFNLKNSESISVKYLQELSVKVKKEKRNLLNSNKNVIFMLLKKQILKNYLTEKEYKKTLLTKDNYIKKAIELLDNPNKYRKILKPNP